MHRWFGYFVVAGMALGIAAGLALNAWLTPAAAKDAAANFSIITGIFLSLIKMIIAPLVFSTLVVGIAHMEDAASIGRVGIKTLGWFIGAGLVSLTLGLVLVQWLHPGSGMSLPHEAGPTPSVDAGGFTLKDFVSHLVPTSIVDA